MSITGREVTIGSGRDAPVTVAGVEAGQRPTVLAPDATVLVVDEDEGLRHVVVDRMAEQFGRVLEAPSAELALYVCGSRAVDVVATSARLPGMGADALCAELAGHGGPPVVAYGIAGDGAARAAWLDAGGADCTRSEDPMLVTVRCRAVLRRSRPFARPTRRRPASGAARDAEVALIRRRRLP